MTTQDQDGNLQPAQTLQTPPDADSSSRFSNAVYNVNSHDAMNAPASQFHAIFPGLPQLFSSDSHLAFSFNFIVSAEPPIIATGVKPNIPTTLSYDKHVANT